MTKRCGSFSFIATAATLSAVIAWGGLLHAQQQPSNPDAQQSQTQKPQSQQPPDTQAPPAQQSPQQPGQPPQTPDQAQPPQSTMPGAQATAPDAQSAAPAGSKEFEGTVVKQGDKFKFQDSATGTTYDIDHQEDVKKFEGKKVRFRGTLDADGKTIHVQ